MIKKTIKHLNGTKKDSEAVADIRKTEFVDIEWHSTPTFNLEINFNKPSDKNAYKIFDDKDNEDE